MDVRVSEDGKFVIAVEIDGDVWRLKKPMSVSGLPELTKHIAYVIENFDFGEEQEWPDKELYDFLEKELTDRQKLLFGNLAKSEGWKPIEDLIEFLTQKDGKQACGVTIAGLLGPITRKCRGLKKESIFEKKYVEQENRYYYRIKPTYIPVTRNAVNKENA
jgi:hypothetical protein